MKKIISLLLALVLTLSLTLVFTSCELFDSGSAYDDLTDTEKKLFDAFLEAIDESYNPSKIKILKVSYLSIRDDGTVYATMQIQGTNGLGGTITQWNTLMNWDGGGYFFMESSEGKGNAMAKEVSVAKLNDALAEYWTNLGI